VFAKEFMDSSPDEVAVVVILGGDDVVLWLVIDFFQEYVGRLRQLFCQLATLQRQPNKSTQIE
jgi:CRISPR/Cas system-associated protein Cas10 (large subunit of type III CRISPR-Cas system)